MQALHDAHVALGESPSDAALNPRAELSAGSSTFKWPAGNVFALEPGT
jgi:hypothetical protein